MGVDGDLLSSARYPAAAYNATDDELLVCWEGDDAAPSANADVEIYCQRLDGATGAEIGANDFRVSDMGPDLQPLSSRPRSRRSPGRADPTNISSSGGETTTPHP